jgi:hypothetical protein
MVGKPLTPYTWMVYGISHTDKDSKVKEVKEVKEGMGREREDQPARHTTVCSSPHRSQWRTAG